MIRLATCPQDYRKCHKLASEAGFNGDKYSFPTVIDDRDGEITGFISTSPSKEAVMVGRIIVSPGTGRAFRGLKLVQGYDNALKAMGIKEYLIPVIKSRKDVIEITSTFAEQFAEDSENVWFKRIL